MKTYNLKGLWTGHEFKVTIDGDSITNGHPEVVTAKVIETTEDGTLYEVFDTQGRIIQYTINDTGAYLMTNLDPVLVAECISEKPEWLQRLQEDDKLFITPKDK